MKTSVKFFVLILFLISGLIAKSQCVFLQPSNCDNYIKQVKIIGSLNTLQTVCSGVSVSNYNFNDSLIVNNYYFIEVFTNRAIQVGAWLDYNNNSDFELNERVTLVSESNLADTTIPAVFRIKLSAANNIKLLIRCYADTVTQTLGCFNYVNGESEIYNLRAKQNYPLNQFKNILPSISFNTNNCDRLFGVTNLFSPSAILNWYYSDDSLFWLTIPTSLISGNSIIINRLGQKKYYKYILYTPSDTIKSNVFAIDLNTKDCSCRNAPVFSNNVCVKNISIENSIVYVNTNPVQRFVTTIGNFNQISFKKGNTYNLKCGVYSNTGTIKSSYVYFLIDKNKDMQFSADEVICTSSVDSVYVESGDYNLYFNIDDKTITGQVNTAFIITEFPVKSFCNTYTSGHTLLFSINIINPDSLCSNLKVGRIICENSPIYKDEKFSLKVIENNTVKNQQLIWYKSIDGNYFTPMYNKLSPVLIDSISSITYYKVKIICGNDSQETTVFKATPRIKYCLPKPNYRTSVGFSFLNFSDFILGKIEHEEDVAPLFYGCKILNDTITVYKNSGYNSYAKFGYPKGTLNAVVVAAYIDKNKNGIFDSTEQLFKKHINYGNILNAAWHVDSNLSVGIYNIRFIAKRYGDTLISACKNSDEVQSIDLFLKVLTQPKNTIKTKFKLYSNDEELCKGQYPRINIVDIKPIANQRFYWEYSNDNKLFYSEQQYTIEPFLLFRFDTNIYVRCIINNNSDYDTTESIYFKQRYFFDCYNISSSTGFSGSNYVSADTVKINGISLLGRGMGISNGFGDLTRDTIWNLSTNTSIPLKYVTSYNNSETVVARIFIDRDHDGIFDSSEMIHETFIYKTNSTRINLDSFQLDNSFIPGITRLRFIYEALDKRSLTAYGLMRRGFVLDLRIEIKTGQNCSAYTPVIFTEHNIQCVTNPFIIRIKNNNYLNNIYIWYSSTDSLVWKQVNNTNSELLTSITEPTYFKTLSICNSDTLWSNSIKIDLDDPLKCPPPNIYRIVPYGPLGSSLKTIKVGTSDLGNFTHIYNDVTTRFNNTFKLQYTYGIVGSDVYKYYRNSPHILWCNKSTNTPLVIEHQGPLNGVDSVFIAVFIDSNRNNNFENNELIDIKKLKLPSGGPYPLSFNFNSTGMSSGKNMTLRFVVSKDSLDIFLPKKTYLKNTVHDFTIVFFDTNYAIDKLRIVDTREGTGGFASVSLERTSKNGISKFYFEKRNLSSDGWNVIDSSNIPTFILPYKSDNRYYRIRYKSGSINHYSDSFNNKVEFFSEYNNILTNSNNLNEMFANLNEFSVDYPDEYVKLVPTLTNQIILRKGTDNYYYDGTGAFGTLFPYLVFKDSLLKVYENPAIQTVPFIYSTGTTKFRIPDFIKSGSYNYALNNSDYLEKGIHYFFPKKTYDILILDALPCGDSINPTIHMDKPRYCKNQTFNATLNNYSYCDQTKYQWFYSYDKNNWVAYSNSDYPFCRRSSDTSIYLKCRISYNNKSKDVIIDSQLKIANYDFTCICQSQSTETYSVNYTTSISKTDIAQMSLSNLSSKSIFKNKYLEGQYSEGGNNYRDFKFVTPIKLPKKNFNFNLGFMSEGSSSYYYSASSFIDFNRNYTFDLSEYTFQTGFAGSSGFDLIGGSEIKKVDSTISSGKRLFRIALTTYSPTFLQYCGKYPSGETQDYWLDFRNNIDFQLSPDSALLKPIHLCNGPRIKSLKVKILNYGIDTLKLINDSLKIKGTYFRNNSPLFSIDTFITNINWVSDSNMLLDLKRNISYDRISHDSIALKLIYPLDFDTLNNFIRHNLFIDSLIIADLGPDRTKCKNDIISLKSNSKNIESTYKWNTGQTSPEIFVLDEGEYILTITNSEGCKTSDTIMVRNSSLPENLLPTDTFTCNSKILTISLPIIPNVFYQWENGDTSSTRKFVANGEYKLKISNNDGCFLYNTMSVTLDSLQDVIIQKSASQCKEYQPSIKNFNPDYKYLWSNGSSIINPVFTQSGDYYLRIMNPKGCILIDTLKLTIIELPKRIFPDTTFLSGDTVELKASVSKSYLWNTGDTSQSIKITQSGKYSVRLSNAVNCDILDSTYVKIIKLYHIKLGGTKFFCEDSGITISNLPSHLHYLWNDGYKNSIYYISIPGTYWFTATDSVGNIYKSDTLTVVKRNKPNCDFTMTKTASLKYSLSSIDTTNDTYSWQISGNTFIGKKIDFTFPTYANYTISLTSTKNGCTNTCANSLNILAGINGSVETDFMVYPNPAQDKIYFKGTVDQFENIRIYDAKGVLLFYQDDFKLTTPIDIGDYSDGIFLIIVNNSTAFKIVKNRIR